ncbi:MAG: c-type cytochrome [Pseudomonadota bacterium]
MKLWGKLGIATIAAALASGTALAQSVKPEDAIKYRQGVLRAIGWNFGPMGAMVKGEIPFDKAKFERNAGRVAALAPMPWEGFMAGTETGDTRAKPEIWLDQEKFQKLAERMEAETAKLAEVARSGDEAKMKAQFGETAKACKACHDDFRKK